jgi:histidine triad (HIT) family protein
MEELMENNCIFCKIAKNESPAEIEYEDTDVLGFWDIHPKAPVHILIIPKKHISSIQDLTEVDYQILGKMFMAANDLAKKKNIAQSGYRLVINSGRNAGMVVDHLHLHLLGGENLGDLNK